MFSISQGISLTVRSQQRNDFVSPIVAVRYWESNKSLLGILYKILTVISEYLVQTLIKAGIYCMSSRTSYISDMDKLSIIVEKNLWQLIYHIRLFFGKFNILLTYVIM